MESLTNLIEKLKAVDAELDTVRERMNALAVKCDKLEKENESLRANQLPAGAVCWEPVGCNDRPPRDGEWYGSMLDGELVAIARAYTAWQNIGGGRSSDRPIYRRVEAQGVQSTGFTRMEGEQTVELVPRAECDKLRAALHYVRDVLFVLPSIITNDDAIGIDMRIEKGIAIAKAALQPTPETTKEPPHGQPG